MSVGHTEASRPRRLGWGMGLLLVFVAIQVGVVLPPVVLLLLPDGTRLAGPAMAGGFMAAWTMLIAALHVGRRRGWWA
jgi:hypothetical protein